MLANQNETKNLLIEEISLWTDRSIILRYQSTSRIVCVVGYTSSPYFVRHAQEKFFRPLKFVNLLLKFSPQ